MSSFPVRRPAAGFHSLQPESPRAFEMFKRVPDGCELFRTDDNALSPHLRAGEYAVVDMINRNYQFGEVFLCRWECGCQVLRQVKKRQYFEDAAKTIAREGVWFLAMVQPNFMSDGRLDPRGPLFLSDGPLDPVHLHKKLVGRVIGVFDGIVVPDAKFEMRFGCTGHAPAPAGRIGL
jgi:hypothetical protein